MTSPLPSSDVQALFDRIAPVYDQLNDGLSLGLHRVWKQMTVQWSAAQPGATALDVCCGSGDLTRLLAQQVGRTGQVIGLDFSPAQLAIARQRHQHQYPQLPITWVEGNALALPFADHTFDAITMGYGLRNVPDIRRCLAELHRVLKPGAKVAILDFHRPSQPQWRAFQRWYLERFVVPIAEFFGVKEEYAYINPSLDRFPVGSEQKQLAWQAGFRHTVHYAIAGGLMGVLVATK